MSGRTFYELNPDDAPRRYTAHVYADMHSERIRAHDKHDANGASMERKPWDDPAWLPVLMEEVGEVARELCEQASGNRDGDIARTMLRAELVQVGAMVAAWIDALDAPPADL